MPTNHCAATAARGRRHRRAGAVAIAAAWWCAAGVAGAAPAVLELPRNGEVSRHLWVPAGSGWQFGGVDVQPGIAIGVRAPLRATLEARVAPALTMRVGRDASLSLLATRDGAMLVWQLRS